MKKALVKTLQKKYPELFGESTSSNDMRMKIFVSGIECDDGWYELIDVLCESIMLICGKNIPTIRQIKEKFGGLRFYIAPLTDKHNAEKIFNLINKAESASFIICEVCGEKGEMKTNKAEWLKTLCPVHAKELKYE